MDRLPAELLCSIFRLLDHASQCRFRQVCRGFDEVASPLLFEEFHTTFFQSSLLDLKGFASSRLAKHVRKLVVYADALPCLTRKDWEKAIDLRPRVEEYTGYWPDCYDGPDHPIFRGGGDKFWVWKHLPRHNLSSRELELGWQNYQRLFGEQNCWYYAMGDCALTMATRTLPNLAAIAVLVELHSEYANSWPVWKRLRQQIYLGPTDWNKIFEPTACRSRESLREQAARTIMKAMAARNSSLDTRPVTALTLHLEASCKSGLITGMKDQALRTLTAPLEYLQVRWQPDHEYYKHDNTQGHRIQLDMDLNRILLVATHLRSLALTFGASRDFPDENRLDIFRQALPSHFSSLKHLLLSLDVPFEDLVGFLERHSRTLKSLKMANMHVGNGPALLRWVSKNLQLESVYMKRLSSGCWLLPEDDGRYGTIMKGGTDHDCKDARDMREYLLGRLDEMPGYHF